MAKSTKDNVHKLEGMEEVNLPTILLMIFTRVNLITIRFTVKENSLSPIMIPTMDNTSKVSSMEMVHILLLVEAFRKGFGSMVKCMEKGS